MRIAQGTSYTPRLGVERLTTPPVHPVAQMSWGCLWALVWMLPPLALFDLLHLWRFFGFEADYNYFQAAYNFYRFVFAVLWFMIGG